MEETQTSVNNENKPKLDFKDSKYATGRRKTSIAKVWLKKGSGKIYVNGKLFTDYFSDENHKMQIVRPFEIICASPLGNAVKITSTSLKYFLLNFTILGNFFKEIDLS